MANADAEKGRQTSAATTSGAPRPGSEQPPAESPKASPPAPPNGGARAWLVSFGGFCGLVCTFGYLNSFGVFQSYYQTHFLRDYSPSDISWIGSVQICLLFFGGIVSGPIADRYGTRAVSIPAALILVFSVMMVSLASEYYQFILAQGILFGIGCGLLFTPTLSTVGQYFTSLRPWAMGVVVAGASIGGIIFPLALDRMLNHTSLGFGWSIRIVGFIMIGLLSFATIALREHAPRRAKSFLLPEAFRNPAYVITTVGFFFSLFGFWTPIFYTATYATSLGIPSSLALSQIAVLNAASFFGRTLPNFFATKVGAFNSFIFMTTCTAILLFCWTSATTSAGIFVYLVFYGFFSGALVSLISPCLAQVCPRPSDIGTYIGMSLATCSVAGLVGTPINGALISHRGFDSAGVFSGVMVLAGAILTCVAKLVLNRKFLAVV